MRRKPKIVQATAKALTDPRPQFVSLVESGANMTPFLAVKADKPPAGDATAAKAASHEVARIVFRAEKFADEGAVQAWLDDGGYEGYTITKAEGGFEVAGTYTGDDVREIAMDGMTIFVAPRPVEAAKETPPPAEAVASVITSVQPVAQKADSSTVLAQKFAGWCAMYAEREVKSFTDLIAFCNDGLPPGIYEVTEVLYAAVRRSALARDMAGIRAAATEYGDLVARMVELIPSPAEKADTETLRQVIKALAPDIAVAIPQEDRTMTTKAAAPEGTAGAQATTPADAPAHKGTTPPAATEERVQGEGNASNEGTANEGAAGQEGGAEGTAKAAETTLDAVLALVGKLTANVDALTTSVATMRAEAAASADTLAQRVSVIEDVRQTQKGADADETSAAKAGTSPTRDSEHVAALRTTNMLGMRALPRPAP
jgi:hypothetical protein